MPFIRGSINGLLQEYGELIPVDRQAKPSLLQNQFSGLQPTLNFRPAPLVDKLIRIEQFALAATFAGAEDTVNWTSTPVPLDEIHRYVLLAPSHNHGSARQFALDLRMQRASAPLIFSSGRMVLKSIQDSLRTNMLSTHGSADNESMSFYAPGFDLYSGMSWGLTNTQALAALSVVTLQGIRLILRGPAEFTGIDVSGDIVETIS